MLYRSSPLRKHFKFRLNLFVFKGYWNREGNNTKNSLLAQIGSWFSFSFFCLQVGFEAFLPRLGGIKSPGQVTFSGYYANWPEDKLPKPCVTGDKPFFGEFF